MYLRIPNTVDISGRLAFPFQVRKFGSYFGDNSTGSTEICRILQPARPSCLGLQDVQNAKQGCSCDIHQVPIDNGSTTEDLSVHQV